LRATIKSVEGIGSIPVLYMQQSLRRPMTLLQQQLRLKRCFGLGSMPPPSLPATNAKRWRKGAERRSNPSIDPAERWIASLRSQ
jgi:hypothetical protein